MDVYRGPRHRFTTEEGTTATQGMAQAREYLGRSYQQAEQLVVRNPMSSFLTMFGVGLGLGLLISMAIPGRQRSFSELSTTEKAQWMGRQVRDTLTGMVPERLSRGLHR